MKKAPLLISEMIKNMDWQLNKMLDVFDSNLNNQMIALKYGDDYLEVFWQDVFNSIENL